MNAAPAVASATRTDRCNPVTLWLVEDEPMFQSAFAGLIADAPDLELERVFGAFEPVQEALDAGYTGPFPCLAVLDIRLPGMGGLEAARRLREAAPDCQVLMLTSLDDPEMLFGALQAGASGYVLKGGTPDALLDAVRQTARGGMAFSPGVAQHVRAFFAAPQESPLTAREEEVLLHQARGKTKRAIADAMHLSPHTVDSHIRSIYRKLHASSGIEAIVKAVQLRIIDPDTLDASDG